MQSSTAAIRRTYGQSRTVDTAECESVFVDRVQYWLEGEDSSLALLAGYGVCALAAVYLLGCVVRAIF